MPRVKSGVQAHARHKKVIKAAKGYRGRRKSCFRIATHVQTVDPFRKNLPAFPGIKVFILGQES